MALVAALESLPQLYATPLASALFYRWLHAPSRVFLVFVALQLTALALVWLGVRREADDDVASHTRALLVNEAGAAPPGVLPTPATPAHLGTEREQGAAQSMRE